MARLFLLILTIAGLCLSLIHPLYPVDQALQHPPTVIAIILLARDTRRPFLSFGSLLAITVFLWLHILGARYVYSNVPYDRWMQSLTGTSLSAMFGWERNHYDRIVHFAFGGLALWPLAELAERCGNLSRRAALVFGFLAIHTLSGLYEIFEWLLTILMSPARSESYNGQQGDMWDAQKDMALALCGSLVWLGVIWMTSVGARSKVVPVTGQPQD